MNRRTADHRPTSLFAQAVRAGRSHSRVVRALRILFIVLLVGGTAVWRHTASADQATSLTPVWHSGFVETTSVTPQPINPGASFMITTSVTAGQTALQNGQIQIAVYNSANQLVGQKNFMSQTISTGQTMSYSYAWTAPAPGTFRVAVGVMCKSWNPVSLWANNAATINVTSTTPPTATPTTQTPPSRTPIPTNTAVPATSTSTPVPPTATSTKVPATSTNTPTAPSTATPLPSQTPIPTNTSVPPTATGITVVNPTFTQATTVTPSSPATGGTSYTISATITDISGSLQDGIIDIEVYNAASQKVGQQFFTGQNLGPGQQVTQVITWTAPAPGVYQVGVGVFKTSWTGNYFWAFPAATITASPATATATSTNTAVPPSSTNTPVPPTATGTPVPATATGTGVPTIGTQWTNVTGNLANMPSQCGNLTMLSAVPNSAMVIAGVALDGLWATNNSGASWSQLGTGSGSDGITNRPSWISYDPLNPAIFWESGIYNSNGAYKTTNSGNTFQHLGTVTHDDFISVDFTDPNRQTLLVGGHEQSQSVWKSTDGGQTWTNIGVNLPAGTGFSTSPLVINSQTYIVNTDTSWSGGSPGIYRTVNGGTTWTKVSSVDPSGPPLVTANGTIYWSSGGSLVKSTDQGVTWNLVGSGLTGNIHPIELPDGRLVSVGATTLVVSSDGGSTWSPIGPTLPYSPAGVIYSPSSKAFFIWHWDCGSAVLPNAIEKLDYA